MVYTETIKQIPAVTVHGRFQPPIHVNHWEYIQEGFRRAEHVTLLITNPFQNEAYDYAASWRSDPDNNPFTYDEREYMFKTLLSNLGIDQSRYDIRPFNIKDPDSFKELDPTVPNLVNVYSEWSEKKDALFQEQGLKTIRLERPKKVPVSGTLLRQILSDSQVPTNELGDKLVAAGLIKEALPGLLAVLKAKRRSLHGEFGVVTKIKCPVGVPVLTYEKGGMPVSVSSNRHFNDGYPDNCPRTTDGTYDPEKELGCLVCPESVQEFSDSGITLDNSTGESSPLE